MRFLIKEPHQDQNVHLIYRAYEYSFDVEPFEGGGITSIMIDFLQLEIDDEGRVLYVWGYCPLIEYEETSRFPKKHTKYSLYVDVGKPLVPGISHRINQNNPWPICINKKRGWICLGNPEIKGYQLVEFAPDCVAVLDGENLIAVWLHPKFLSAPV
jgi:hypothetical protein